MRLFNFLSKFTFICNMAFLLFVFFRWREMQKVVTGSADNMVPVPIFKDLIIILGMCAIVINLLMNIFYVFFLLRGRMKGIKPWLPLINFLFLLAQIFYFFFY
jgi:hypothetical protein